MIKNLLSMLFAMLIFMAISDDSVLFAETYQWTGADGSIHFSDTPPENAPSGKQPIVQRDNISLKPSKPSEKTSTTTSIKNIQPSKKQSWRPDSDCIQELGQWEMKMKNDDNFKKCTDTVMHNMRQKYSPECYKAFETKKYTFTAACQQEMQAVGETMMTELQQCSQLKANISSKCQEQLDRYREKVKACGEITQRIIRICGSGQQKANLNCLEEHQADLADCR